MDRTPNDSQAAISAMERDLYPLPVRKFLILGAADVHDDCRGIHFPQLSERADWHFAEEDSHRTALAASLHAPTIRVVAPSLRHGRVRVEEYLSGPETRHSRNWDKPPRNPYPLWVGGSRFVPHSPL